MADIDLDAIRRRHDEDHEHDGGCDLLDLLDEVGRLRREMLHAALEDEMLVTDRVAAERRADKAEAEVQRLRIERDAHGQQVERTSGATMPEPQHIVPRQVLLDLCDTLGADPTGVSRIEITPGAVELVDRRAVVGEPPRARLDARATRRRLRNAARGDRGA